MNHQAMTHRRGRWACFDVEVLALLAGLWINALFLVPAVCGAELPEELIEGNNRGVALMGQFNYAEATQQFTQLDEKFPAQPVVRINRAIATLNRQQQADPATGTPSDEQSALAIIEKVLADHPDDPHARYCAGLLLYRGSKTSEALKHFEFVCAHDPQDAFAAYLTGQCLMEDRSRVDEALQWFQRSAELDPYLRSAFYGASQLLRRQRKLEESKQYLEKFNKLGDDPRGKVFQFKYTMMGPKGETRVLGQTSKVRTPKPSGPVFADVMALPTDIGDNKWSEDVEKVNITSADINGDGKLDLFLTSAIFFGNTIRNAVLIANNQNGFDLQADHPLASVTEINAPLWGDFDNNGRIDVYFCRRGPNQLWRLGDSGWEDVTESTQTAGGDLNTVDGTMVDADHDGDLDLFVVNADGPDELFNNNRDGSFRAIAGELKIDGGDRPSRGVLFEDLDNDRNLDLLVIRDTPPHSIYWNDLVWQYRPAEGFDSLLNEKLSAIVSADADVDGRPELYGLTPTGLNSWTENADGIWEKTPVDMGDRELSSGKEGRLAVADFDGDGNLDLAVSDGGSLTVFPLTATQASEIPAAARPVPFLGIAAGMLAAAALLLLLAGGWKRAKGIGVCVVGLAAAAAIGFQWIATIRTDGLTEPATGGHTAFLTLQGSQPWWLTARDASRGVELVRVTTKGPELIPAGQGRYPLTSLWLTGKENAGDAMRSNASGIGTRLQVRVHDRWTNHLQLRSDSGPGQSLLPALVGSGGDSHIDFVSLRWPDGLSQTEMNLETGKAHHIAETQRQVGSCPVLFVWDGEKYRFVTDFLGVGGIGFLLSPGEYVPSDPTENLLLPTGCLIPKQGRFSLKMSEPMEENCYLDNVRLVTYDLPSGWKMTLDERMHTGGPEPTGATVFYREELCPTTVINERHEDVTKSLATADGQAAPVGELDTRFIGRLQNEHVLTMNFSKPLDQGPGNAVLVADGWIEYPYSQTMFAAWQANADFDSPTLEARGGDGQWTVVLEKFGYPAGMPRQMSVPLDNLPRGTTQLRLRTNQEIYWDRLAVVFVEPNTQVQRHNLPLVEARVQATGFAKRTDGPQRRPHYDYGNRVPFWDCNTLRGKHTQFGPATPLLLEADEALVIFGPGEEVHVEFAAETLPASKPGWTRHFVLESVGWCKDRDLYTKDGTTVGPLPSRAVRSQEAETLHNEFNTRYVD